MILFSKDARTDLRSILQYLGERSAQAAAKVDARINQTLVDLDARLYDGPPVKMLTDGRRAQSWPVRPYRIYYRRQGRTVLVLRIYDERRRPIARRQTAAQPDQPLFGWPPKPDYESVVRSPARTPLVEQRSSLSVPRC